jgi:hypothetical protein
MFPQGQCETWSVSILRPTCRRSFLDLRNHGLPYFLSHNHYKDPAHTNPDVDISDMPGLLCALLLSSISVATAASCACSSVLIPVHVDVLVPKDPTDVFAGLKSSTSSLRRVDDTYDIYGVFCQPDTVPTENAGQYHLISFEAFHKRFGFCC